MIKKDNLFRLIKEELDGNISYSDISSVINIFIDEFKKELKAKKRISIFNFGYLQLKSFNPKIIKDIATGLDKMSGAYSALRLKLSRNAIRYINKDN